MADTAIIWTRVSNLKDEAALVYADLEQDGDLLALNNSLAKIRDKAEEIRDVVSRIDEILGEL